MMRHLTVAILIIMCQRYCNAFITHMDTQTKEDPIEIIITEQSPERSARSISRIPDDLKADFSVDGERVELHLRRNPEITDDVPVLLNRRGKIRKYRVPSTEDVGAYDDINYEASVLIWDRHKHGQSRFYMFGTFLIKNQSYLIQPPTKDFSTTHSVSKLDDRKPVHSDYTRPVDNDEMKFSGTDNAETSPHNSRYKRQVTDYEIEVLVAVDFQVYSFWYSQTNGTLAERNTSTINTIKQFYSFVMNDMNLRYQTVTGRNFTITCLFAGIYIADTSSGAPFVEDNIFATGSGSARSQVRNTVVLEAFKNWANTNLSTRFDYDAAMLFTGYDIVSVSGSTVSTSVAGFATVGGLCGNSRYSINEDHFNAALVTIASHELGHNLNARHDGDGNSCSASDGFVMTAVSSTQLSNSAFNKGQWVFSSCSLDYFQNFIASLNSAGTNCMTSRSSNFNASALDDYANDFAGQIYPPDQQCNYTRGTGSFLARSFYSGNFSRICEVLACTNPLNTLSFSSSITWEDTSCGNGKFCEASNCVASSSAPSGLTESCLFGSVPGNVPGQSQNCADFLGAAASSYYCYQSVYELSCCEECGVHRANNVGIDNCEFGDKASGCSGISRRSCYTNEGVCCSYCNSVAGNIPNCTYGDRASNCRPSDCEVEANLAVCCETCATTTSTSTTTTTTTSQTTTTTTQTTTTTPTTTSTTTSTPTTTTTTPTATSTTPTTTTTTPTTTSTTPTTTSTTTTTTSTTPTTSSTTPTTTTTTTTTTSTTPTTSSTTPTTTTTTPTTTSTTLITTTTTPTTTSTTPTTTSTTPTTTSTTPTTTSTTPTTTSTTPTTTTTTPTTTSTTPTTTSTTPTTTSTTPSTTSATPTTTSTTLISTTTTPTTISTTPTTTSTTPTTSSTTPTTTSTTPTTTSTTPTTTTTIPTTTLTTPTTTSTTPTTTSTTPTTTSTTLTTTSTTPTTTSTTSTTTSTTPTTTTTTPTTTSTTPTTTSTTPTTTSTTPTTTSTTPTTTSTTQTTTSTTPTTISTTTTTTSTTPTTTSSTPTTPSTTPITTSTTPTTTSTTPTSTSTTSTTTSTTPTTTSTTPSTTSTLSTTSTPTRTTTPSTSTQTTTTSTTTTLTTSQTTSTTTATTSLTTRGSAAASRRTQTITVFIVTVTNVNFEDTSSSSYVSLRNSLLLQLQTIFRRVMGTRFRFIVINVIRLGSLIVDYTVVSDDDPAATADFTEANRQLLTGEQTVTIDNQTVAASSVQIGNTTFTNETISTNICELFTLSGGCNSGFRCVEVNGDAVCEPEKTTSGIGLVLAVAIGLPVFLILVLVLIGVILRAARLRRLKSRSHSKTSTSERYDANSSGLRFPTVAPYKGISNWNEAAYMTAYPHYLNMSQSSDRKQGGDHRNVDEGHRKKVKDAYEDLRYKRNGDDRNEDFRDRRFSEKRQKKYRDRNIHNYAYDNRAANFDSTMADTYIKAQYEYA